MRPVLRFGLTADGVHRWLYSLADPNNQLTRGITYFYPRMAAMEYGLPYGRFAKLCKELIDDGRLVPLRAQPDGTPTIRMAPFLVERPAHYNPETTRDPAKLTPEEMDRAIELFEQLTDQIEDAWDEENDENDDQSRNANRPQEGLRISTNQSELAGTNNR